MSKAKVSLDPRIWHACAGGMIQMPLPNSYVYYFPQGHAEHAHANVDFGRIPFPTIPPCILCKVVYVKYMAHAEQEEVYAKIMLCPVENNISSYHVNNERNLVTGRTVSDFSNKLSYFAKTLTESDVYDGCLTVPHDGAEAVFPELDCSKVNPFQTLVAKDIRGNIWKFWHEYRGIPRRHLLSTEWSAFVNRKRLVVGCSVVFMRLQNGDLCVGVRRPKFVKRKNGRNVGFSGRGGVEPEDVIKAVSLAVKGQEFEITYYPHAGTPEFVVKASLVDVAMRVQWRVGMRFKMAFESEGLSRTCWLMGTVCFVQDVDPFLWPKSPWRRLQVEWDDERDMLQKVKCVSPWLVKLLSNMPSSHFPASVQGAKHDQSHDPLADPNPTHMLELTLFPKPLDESHDTIDLTLGRCSYTEKKNNDKPILRLFGHPIHTDQHTNHSSDENANEIDAVQTDGVINESRLMMTGVGYVLKSPQPCKELYEQTFFV